jgi:hypothetical protein
VSKQKLTIQADDASKTQVKRSNVGGGWSYWEITLGGLAIIIRQEAFDDLFAKIKAVKDKQDRDRAAWQAKWDAERAAERANVAIPLYHPTLRRSVLCRL